MIHRKICILGGGGKRGKLWQFADLRESLGKKEEGDVFEVGVDIPMHTTLIMVEIIWLK